jgi:hypothetical protein
VGFGSGDPAAGAEMRLPLLSFVRRPSDFGKSSPPFSVKGFPRLPADAPPPFLTQF